MHGLVLPIDNWSFQLAVELGFSLIYLFILFLVFYSSLMKTWSNGHTWTSLFRVMVLIGWKMNTSMGTMKALAQLHFKIRYLRGRILILKQVCGEECFCILNWSTPNTLLQHYACNFCSFHVISLGQFITQGCFSGCISEMELASARRTRIQVSTEEEMTSTSGSPFSGSNTHNSSNVEISNKHFLPQSLYNYP